MLTEVSSSPFVPVALGFFGLGTGYLVWGPQELWDFPRRDDAVDRALGVWGIFLPGLCQLVTGILIFVGLTWFPVFDARPLYVAAVAFTAFGIHWFALGWNRYRGNDARPNAGMSVAFVWLSAVAAFVLFGADIWAEGVLFVLLALVYLADLALALGVARAGRALGAVHLVTGLWLMYLTAATLVNVADGWSLPA